MSDINTTNLKYQETQVTSQNGRKNTLMELSGQVSLNKPLQNDEELYIGRRKKGNQHMKDQTHRIKLYDNGIDMLLKLPLRETRTLLAMLKYIDWNGKINVTQKQIGEETGIFREYITKTIKNLISKNYITKERIGSKNIYQINENIAWKGWIDTKPSSQKKSSKNTKKGNASHTNSI